MPPWPGGQSPEGVTAVPVVWEGLTVVESRKGVFSVSVVPYTLEHTNLRTMVAGQRVNMEPDLLAKYAESALTAAARQKPVSEDTLRRNGFMQ